MAISPEVQRMQQGMQQGMQQNITMSDDGGSPTAQNFNQRFGEEAYRVLGSRFPNLIPFVRTFKTVDVDFERGFGLGAFVLWAGDNTVHIPVVMYDGDVASCEMVYDRSSKLLSPLVKREIDRIERANENTSNTLVQSPMVENTTQIFSNMYRPPRSTNVVMAGSRVDISSLPASAKKDLVALFNENPDVLSKVAEFYPISELSAKLAYRNEVKELPAVPATESTILRVADLLKQSCSLDSKAKASLLDRGYYIKEGSFRGDMVPKKQIPAVAQDQFNITVVDDKWGGCGTGYVLATNGLSLERHRCIVAGRDLFTRDEMVPLGHYDAGDRVVVDYDDGITARDLDKMGWVKITNYVGTVGKSELVYVMYPTSTGGYRLLVDAEGRSVDPYVRAEHIRRIDKTVVISTGFMESITATPDIEVGSVSLGNDQYIVPRGSYVREVKSGARSHGYLTLSGLYRILNVMGQKVSLLKDGPSYTLDVAGKVVTAHSEPEIAKIANELLGLGNEDFQQLKAARSALFFPGGMKKRAFSMYDSPVEGRKYINEPTDLSAAHAPTMPPNETLSAAAGVKDKDLFDLSMLAAVSANPDIRSTVLDSVSTFMEANSEIGTILLNMAVHEKEFDEYYGSEEFVALRGNLRKIFKQFGDVINQLREFIVME